MKKIILTLLVATSCNNNEDFLILSKSYTEKHCICEFVYSKNMGAKYIQNRRFLSLV